MSLFKQQLTAARAKRVEVDLQAEGSVATESLEADVSQEIDVDAIMDQFAEDRDGLNALLAEGALENLGTAQIGDETGEVAVESLEAEQRDTSKEDGVTQETSEEVTQTAGVEDTTEVVQETTDAAVAQVEGEADVSQEAEAAVEQTEGEGVTQEEGEVAQTEDASVVAEETVEQVEETPTQEMPENEDLPEDAIPGYEEDEDDETVEAEMAVMEEVESDMAMIESLGQEMSMIENSIVAIESYGINPSAMAILQTTGLLSDTVLEAVGIESLGYAGPKSDETAIALEALADKGEAKKTSWAAKIVSMAKGVADKVMSVLGGIWNKITSVTKAVAGYTWDKVKAGAAVVKAHPYKTIIAVVAAIAAVAGIVAFTATSGPAVLAVPAGKGVNAMIKFSEAVASKVNAIKWPFGKIGAEVSEKGQLLLTHSGGAKGVAWTNVAPEATTIAKSGWTSTVFNGVSSALGRSWKGIADGVGAMGGKISSAASSVASGVKSFGSTAVKAGTDTLDAANKTVKSGGSVFTAKGAATNLGVLAAAMWIGGTIKFIYGLIFKVVAFGLRVIYNTMKSIANAVKGTQAA